MAWWLQVEVTAGLGALLLGPGVLWREPRRPRNRHFALLCLALAIWTLGVSAEGIWDGDFPWNRVFLVGSCAVAPLGLHFSLVVVRRRGSLARSVLAVSYGTAAVLYALVWTPFGTGTRWNTLALPILGAILLLALGLLLAHDRSLPPGPERRAHRLLFLAGLIVVIGGLSDFLPRAGLPFPRLGATSVLLFLVMVGAVILRHRFMDVEVLLTRVVILVVGAAAAGLLLFAVARRTDARFLPLFLTVLVVLLVSAFLGRGAFSETRAVLRSQDPVALALLDVSRRLQGVVDVDGVWEAIRVGRRALPGDVHVEVALRDEQEPRFEVRFRAGEGGPTPPLGEDAALPRLLLAERLPLTTPFLERESQETHGRRRQQISEALGQVVERDARLVVPLIGNEDLMGWIAVGGGFPDRYLTAEIAAAFLAVSNQAVACLERIRAIAESRRREALAAVGEMAAGLAHEVRNPLAAIRGAAQTLTPEATPGQAREMLEVIEEETERLGRVVGEFLEYARPSSPRREIVPLDGLVRQALRTCELAGRAPVTEIESLTDVATALGDPDQLRRAFENVIRNACEAAGAGGRLRISIGRHEGHVYARFEDNGPGIDEERVAELFRPFYTTRPGGTGLGLALVHRIVVENHAGRVEVEGRPGRGAAFTLVLPAARAVDGEGS